MKKSTVQVKVREQDGSVGTRELESLVSDEFPGLCVHLRLGCQPNRKSWNVTQIVSGLGIATYYEQRKQAIWAAKHIAEVLDWRQTPEEISALPTELRSKTQEVIRQSRSI